ncbi:7-cyano-7-deazaguanine synthase [Acidianus sp. RZ1]|uniref:7-cyano-7-deazaguanine synthase n=1 Tax=Acidianus sp. RZ1 TaxID=1540082 RepID=UPI0014921EA6|nr:7-cyano-7-deazaguanine synthase [Acidianus sp. RZ1]NON61177.1 7-cyano-7-deazaguanine synthase [Acidianus sp. RZ1]
MRSLLLMSGGLDSTAAAFSIKERDYDCLFLDYGQRSAKMQRRYVKENCGKLGKRVIELDIKKLGDFFAEGYWMRPHEPIVHRNVILLAIAITYAKEKGYDKVILATVNEECDYETNKPNIIRELKRLGEVMGIEVNTPYINLGKSLLLKIGISHGMDPAKTYSCLLGHEKHCGKCSQCLHRKLAFKALGLIDPTQYI